MKWEHLFQEGALIDLDSSVFGNQIRLIPSDLGLEDTTEMRETLRLGYNRFVKQDVINKFHKLSSEAHRLIWSKSVHFGNIDGVRFVPQGSIEDLNDELNRIKAKFDQMADDFISEFDLCFEQMKPTLIKAFTDLSGRPDIARLAIDRVERMKPKDIRSKFNLNWKFFNITVPTVSGLKELAKNEKDDVINAIQGMVKDLRSKVQDRMNALSELVASQDGKLSMKTFNSVEATLVEVEELNFLQDPQLIKAIADIRAMMDHSLNNDMAKTPILDRMDSIKQELRTDMAQAVVAAEQRLIGHKRVIKR